MLLSRVSQPLNVEGCSEKFKNKFVLPALARHGGAPPLRAPQNSSCCLCQGDGPCWELGPRKQKGKEKKINSFLGHLRFPAPRVVVFPATTLSYF